MPPTTDPDASGVSPVSLAAVDAPDQPTVTPDLEDLYRGFEKELLVR